MCSLCKVSDKQEPFNIPCDLKSMYDEISLPICWLVTNICHMASHLLDHLQGSFTAWIYLFSVIEEQMMLGDPCSQMI